MPATMFYRALVRMCTCCFRHKDKFSTSFPMQFEMNKGLYGGWYSSQRRQKVITRETFYVFLAQEFCGTLQKNGTEQLVKFVNRLTRHMTTQGQVPWAFEITWLYGEKPVYRSRIRRSNVVDANAQYIIMVWWLYDKHPALVNKLFLHCQRAWRWLQHYIRHDTLEEPLEASWETTRQHDGVLLLTNIYLCQAARHMELISMMQSDKKNQSQFKHMHDKLLTKWVPEIYKTQETLPRILAILWNIVPENFLMSFQEQLKQPWVPLRTCGPMSVKTTLHSRVYGFSDQHTHVVWPWIGFLWICILVKRHKRGLAQGWWNAYMTFHTENTLYDMYSAEFGRPVRRAFLKANASHSQTLALHIAAKNTLEQTPV